MIYSCKDLSSYVAANLFLVEHLGVILEKWAFDIKLAQISCVFSDCKPVDPFRDKLRQDFTRAVLTFPSIVMCPSCSIHTLISCLSNRNHPQFPVQYIELMIANEKHMKSKFIQLLSHLVKV